MSPLRFFQKKPTETPYTEEINKVFICYSTRDRNIADELCNYLESNTIRCWIAPRDIIAGNDYVSAIYEAIKEMDAMVVVFSKEANESKYAIQEVQAALEMDKPLFAIRVDDPIPQDRIVLCLRKVVWVDAANEKSLDEKFQELLGKIKT